jgi:hypothetical protein
MVERILLNFHRIMNNRFQYTDQYPNQRMFVVRIRGYAYLVPFVETKQEVFLKTIIPSRKATRIFLDEER